MLLTMSGVTKRFPGVLALDDVSLEVDAGEVLALMGENGAGKSTLMKILGGVYEPDSGAICIDGSPVVLTSVKSAKDHGVALIHQELMLAHNLDLAGNIFLGDEPSKRSPIPRIDRRTMNQRAQELLRRVGLNLPPHTGLKQLTTGQMQMVEIAKALNQKARVLVMDEPTSSLTVAESERLFDIIADLKSHGMAMIYISHRIEEVQRIADRITVLRDGRRVGDLNASETTHDQIVSTMVGRDLSSWYPERESSAGDVTLAVDDLLVPGSGEPVSFQARQGEILGFAGLVGAGRTELMRVLFGVDKSLGGSMTLNGKPYRPKAPSDAIARGVYLAPEDRKQHGLVLPMSVAQNISLPDIVHYRPRGWLQRGTERRVATEQIERLQVKTPTIRQRVVNLSGGNQQKVVLGKWLAMNPTVLILDEPTRGIDVGAKAEIYRHMARLARQGITILMVSSEMEEILGMSDRVVVMHERRMTAVLDNQNLSEESVLSYMTGKEAAA